MYLSQGLNTLLFTVIRLTLQISSIHLISHIASRQLNLTYQERINGSLFCGVKYLLFTKFQAGRKHYLGRFYVALALIITLALNYLPTLLSNQYPVKTIYLPDFKQELDIGTLYTTSTAKLQPGKTSTEDLLFRIGVPLNGSIFSGYTASTPPQIPCQYDPSSAEWIIRCGNETLEFGRDYSSDEQSVYYGNQDRDGRVLLNGTTPEGERFEYFNVSDSANTFALANMYLNLAKAMSNEIYYDMAYRGAGSTEECFSQIFRSIRCIRHSHGYLWSLDTGHLFVITRRAFIVRFLYTLNQTIPSSQQALPILDPGLTTTIDCKQIPTATLERMCTQLNSLRPQIGRSYTTQQRARGPGSTTQWDVVNTFMIYKTVPNGDLKPHIVLEAFHLDMDATLYNSKYKDPSVSDFVDNYQAGDALKLMGQEVFETTYFVNNIEDQYDHSWIQYGFSSEDLHNMTSFIFGGTMHNNGTIVLQTPVLRADISDVAVVLLFTTALIMIICGFVASKDVPSLTRDPITEVLPRTLLPNQDSHVTKERNILMYYLQIAVKILRKRRVANLTLKPDYPKEEKDQEDEEGRLDNDTEFISRSTATTTTTIKPLTYRLCINFEERDRDNSVQLVGITDSIINRSGQLSMSPLL